jgi:hypothetical protein
VTSRQFVACHRWRELRSGGGFAQAPREAKAQRRLGPE